MNHFDFPLQLEVFQRNISRGLATVSNPTLLAKQIKVSASLEKKAFAGETKQSLSCFTKLLSPIWGERDFLQYFLRPIDSFAILFNVNTKQPVRPSLFAVLRFSLRSQVRVLLLALVVGFLLKKKNAPDSDFGSRSPAQSPLSNLVDSLCGWWVSGWVGTLGMAAVVFFFLLLNHRLIFC